MSRIKPFKIEFIDPDTMKLVDLQEYDIHISTDKEGNLLAWVNDIEYPQGIKQLLIKKVEEVDGYEKKYLDTPPGYKIISKSNYNENTD